MRSRGWDVLAWSHRFLPSPSDPREPLVLSDRQARFVLEFYEVDEAGTYLYRRGAIEQAKGWGKSPLGAVLALGEFAGPVAPAIPWVQVAGVAEDAAVANVYAILWQLLSESDGKAARELGIDLGRGRLYLKSNPGAKLEAVTSSAGAREGQRLTFGVFDESHLFVKSNGGHRLARTMRRNAAKTDGRTLELANAPEIGEGSIAEMTEAEYEAGAPGILFSARRPSVEPTPDMDDAALAALLAEVYESAPWVDLSRLVREVRDPSVPWPETLRFTFNLPGSGVLAAVDPGTWAAREVNRELEDGARITLGFDGSHSRDGTALVGCTADGWLFPVEIIERPAKAGDDWRVDRSRVHRAVEHMFENYNVGLLYADPWQWQSEIGGWEERWPDRILTVPTNSTRRMPAIIDRFRFALQEGLASHDGDDDLRRHVLNARLRQVGRSDEGRGVYMIEKAGPGRLIDACVAAMLALEAVANLEPETEQPEVWAAFA